MNDLAPDSSPSFRVRLVAAALLVLAVVIVYAKTLNAPFIFDDDPSIRYNESIRDLRNLRAIFSPPGNGASVSGRPLVNLSFAINYAFGGLDVRGYHAVNLALHAANALLLFGVLHRTLRRIRGFSATNAFWLAGSIALLWAVHPLETEGVICVAHRGELFSAFFYLLTLYAFIRHASLYDEASGDKRRFSSWLALSVAACATGMACKEVMVSAPLIVLLYDRTFVAGTFRDAWRRRHFFYLGLAATWLILLGLLFAAGGTRGTTAGFALGISAWSYALTQCHAILLYLKLSIWPAPLVLDYGRDAAGSLGEVWPQFLGILILIGLTLFALRRRPALGFLGVTFFALLAPSSSFVPIVTQTIAERRMYLALAAVIVLLVVAVQKLLRRASYAFCAVTVVAFAVVTMARTRDYASMEEIWADTTTKRPGNSRAWYSLGISRATAGKFSEALPAFDRALKLDPTNPEVLVGYANALAATGESARAIALYRGGLVHLPYDYPMHYEARHNLGILLLGSGDAAGALENFRVAVELRPRVADAHFSLGNALAIAGRTDEAIAEFEAALAIDPKAIPSRYRLANLLLQHGRSADAASHYEKMIALVPDSVEAHNELGIAYAQLGRVEDARTQFEAVLRLRPDDAGARENLARLRPLR